MSTLHPTIEHAAGEPEHHHELGFVKKYVFSTDHKIIGIQFLFTTLLMLMLGGALALGVRWQLAYTWQNVPLIGNLLFAAQGGAMSPEFYTMLFTMHATVMIFLVIIPILAGAFGNLLIPLQIGADDMAFPTLNMLSYWFMWPAIACFMISFVAGGEFMNAGPAAGWTAYPLLSALKEAAPGSGAAQTWWLLGLTFVGFSSMMGSVNYLTTIINMRAPGMTLFRMPLTIWAMFITAILQAFALPVLTAAGFMLLCDREFGFTFFVPSGVVVNNADPTVGGGQPLLWQHLFWFYSHPAVYIMLLPAMGMVSDMLACMSRKPLFGYKPMIFSIAAIAGLGFIVWGHHVYQRHESRAGHDLHDVHHHDLAAFGHKDVQLDRHDVGRETAVQRGFSELCRICDVVHRGWAERNLHGGGAGRHLFSRHVLHCGTFPLRTVRRNFVRSLWRDPVLVPENVRPHDERHGGEVALCSDVHRL